MRFPRGGHCIGWVALATLGLGCNPTSASAASARLVRSHVDPDSEVKDLVNVSEVADSEGQIGCPETCSSCFHAAAPDGQKCSPPDQEITPEDCRGFGGEWCGAEAEEAHEDVQESVTEEPAQKHVVQIFYESLCPDSTRLLADKKNGLWSSYNQMKHEYQFDLYPYGNARKDEWNQTICQHGSEECKGNLVHQCALRMLNRTESFVLIDCLMDTAGKEIAKKEGAWQTQSTGAAMMKVDGTWVYDQGRKHRANIDFKKDVAEPCFTKLHQPRWRTLVESCVYDGTLGWNVLNYFQMETERVNISWTPAVFFNGAFNQEASHGHDLLSFLKRGEDGYGEEGE